MDKLILESLVNKRLSSHKIAYELGVSQTTVRYWLCKYGLTTNFINDNLVNKKCPCCNIIKPIEEFYNRRNKQGSSPYCKDCSKSQAVDRQRYFKQQCVSYKGNRCSICNYDKCIGALEFHHLDPSGKDFSISNMRSYTFNSSITKELDKCILVCANCHRELHSALSTEL